MTSYSGCIAKLAFSRTEDSEEYGRYGGQCHICSNCCGKRLLCSTILVFLPPHNGHLLFQLAGDLKEIGQCLNRCQEQKLVMAPGRYVGSPCLAMLQDISHTGFLLSVANQIAVTSIECILMEESLLDMTSFLTGSLPKVVSEFINCIKEEIYGM